MHLIRRPLLRRHLKRMVSEGLITHGEFVMVTRARRLSALNSRVDTLAMKGGGKVLALGDGKLLDWLWANRQAIIEFIREVVKLFS